MSEIKAGVVVKLKSDNGSNVTINGATTTIPVQLMTVEKITTKNINETPCNTAKVVWFDCRDQLNEAHIEVDALEFVRG